MEIILASLGVLSTFDEGTVPIGLNSLSTIYISKTPQANPYFLLNNQ